MFGYPSVGVAGFSQIDTSRPLVRGGIVAGLNASLKTIIIDAPVNHGNSGGPVVQLSRTNRLRIIGIATQIVPVPEDVVGAKPGESTMMALGNSGYGVVGVGRRDYRADFDFLSSAARTSSVSKSASWCLSSRASASFSVPPIAACIELFVRARAAGLFFASACARA